MNGTWIVFGLAWALILYTYLLFPLILAKLAQLFGRPEAAHDRPFASLESAGAPAVDASAGIDGDRTSRPVCAERPPNTQADLPRVAMVVAAFNEEAVLADKLSNTWAIDYPADRFEIWIGSDGSDDATTAILESCHDPRLQRRLFTDRRGKISVLNDLMKEIDAEIVVMSDANTMFAPHAVRKLAAHFADPEVGCVSGELSLTQNGGVSGEGLYWKYENWIKRSESRLGFLIGCNGGIFALRPECFEPLPTSTIVEDFVLTMRVLERGFNVRFEPDARAYEPPCTSSKAEMVRKIRIGAGGFQSLGLTRRLLLPRFGFVAFAFWGHKVLRWCVPFFLIVALGANIALYSNPCMGAFLALQAAGMAISLLAYNARKGSALPRWTRPVSYFYLMNYALFCGFFRFLSGTQRVTWERLPAPAPGAPAARANATLLLRQDVVE